MNGLEIVVAITFLVFACKGAKQGLIMTVCSFVTLFFAIAITQFVTPQVSVTVRENEQVVTFISEQVESVLFQEKKNDEDKPKSEKERIEGLCIPKALKQELIKNNVKKNYEETGVANFQEYISIYVAYSIINALTYIVVFVVVLAFLKIIAHALNLVSKLPGINTLNKMGGLGIGLLEGLLVVWIAFVVITIFCSNSVGIMLYEKINESVWLSYLYNNNVILNVLMKVTKGLF